MVKSNQSAPKHQWLAYGILPGGGRRERKMEDKTEDEEGEEGEEEREEGWR